jgi:medium-chain acyl-[acyl-carrier-protein] hydrolase
MQLNPGTRSSWLVPIQPNDSASVRLFCIPYAGGSISIFNEWRGRNSLRNVEIHGVQLPGRGPRLREKPFTEAAAASEGIASALLPFTGRSYALFGHSLGALLAYETAQRLASLGAPAPSVLIASARRAPQVPSRRTPTWNLAEKDFVSELRRLQGTPEEILASKELLDLLLPLLRADFQMEETYVHPSGYPPLTCPVVVLGGLGDPDVAESDLLAWDAVTRAGATLQHSFNAGHFYIHSNTAELIHEVATALPNGRFVEIQ